MYYINEKYFEKNTIILLLTKCTLSLYYRKDNKKHVIDHSATHFSALFIITKTN